MPENRPEILVVANLMKDDAAGFAEIVKTSIMDAGYACNFYSFYGDPGPIPVTGNEVLAICLGGDGTVLFVARSLAPRNIPILPINFGKLGFIAEIGTSEWLDTFDAWLQGLLPVSRRVMLAVNVNRERKTVGTWICLNDAVIIPQSPSRMVSLNIQSCGSSLGRYRSDGLIISTPTGSTAYNLSAGGPVLHPELHAFIVTPICPFTLTVRPLVIPDSANFEILIESARRTGTRLVIDGQEMCDLEEQDCIQCARSEWDALIFSHKRLSFYDLLRSKLSWSGGSDA